MSNGDGIPKNTIRHVIFMFTPEEAPPVVIRHADISPPFSPIFIIIDSHYLPDDFAAITPLRYARCLQPAAASYHAVDADAVTAASLPLKRHDTLAFDFRRRRAATPLLLLLLLGAGR